LVDFETASGPLDWVIGVHGIRISFKDNGKHRSATYLPEISLEQGWTKEETLDSLMHKAGYYGKSGGWESVDDFKLTRYQSQKGRAGYDDYTAFVERYQRPN
jgi:AMMECR1 domain-containing protein